MKPALRTPWACEIFLLAWAASVAGCRQAPPADRVRVSGQVEATDVRVAAQVAGRILDLPVTEGNRVAAGAVIARLDTADATLALARARAERAQADAQLRLLRAGSRPEDIRQADAQLAAAESESAVALAEARGRPTRRRSLRIAAGVGTPARANSATMRWRDAMSRANGRERRETGSMPRAKRSPV